MEKFFSRGKLLISGEFVVLDGATALALPTRYGQMMEIREIQEPVIQWKSYDNKGKIWFEEEYRLTDLQTSEAPQKDQNNEVSKMLFLTLLSAAKQNPIKFQGGTGFSITTTIDFPRNWGLGTSSTLIANLAKWLKIDPYKLLEQSFGGSGYDVAVAMKGTAITYEKRQGEKSILKTSFHPPFKDRLFFVHLNQKQNSRESINYYKQQKGKNLDAVKEKISALTHRFITCTDLTEFELLLEVHENLISQLLGVKKVKSRLFPDYKGAVKSLGGWGGDFVLVTGTLEEMTYFKERKYSTIIPYEEMIEE